MTTPTIRPVADQHVVECAETGTVAAWPSLWQAEFHADLLTNGVSPSHAAAQTIATGELPDEAF